MTSEDTGHSPETDRPKIAEKVKFWEEQDRINQELIPRVLKQHELLTSHIRTHETASVNLASLESRMLEGLREAKSQVAQQLDERTASIEERLAASISEGRQAANEMANHITLLEARTAESIVSASRRASIISGVSLTVAIAAVVLALVL